MLSLVTHAGYGGRDYCRKNLNSPLTQVMFFFCNVATPTSQMTHNKSISDLNHVNFLKPPEHLSNVFSFRY